MEVAQVREVVRGEVSKLLGITMSSEDDCKNFFELGMHSLLITQLAHGIRLQFRFEVQLRDFFAGPSVEELANIIFHRIGQAR